MLVIRHGYPADRVDLSEEWLQYAVNHQSLSDGSNSSLNFAALARFGTTTERSLPYVPETWKEGMSGLPAERCAKVPAGDPRTSCLIVHRDPRLMGASNEELADPASELHDPQFLGARRRAAAFQRRFFRGLSGGAWLGTDEEIKATLARGIPVAIGQRFYYGAWNHAVAPSLGMQRDMESWKRGIVGYPEPGSVDKARSPERNAGHSVLIVGYDDEAEILARAQMTDGSVREFRYRGVYYFKNSWGTEGFGSEFEVGGARLPGYGMMAQQYAHEYGTFYWLPIH